MKTSLITTVFNEEKSILPFLESVLKQTTLPNEVIIVDGGSTDKTVEKINQFFKKHKTIHGKLMLKPGNRSVGRNRAIQTAKNELILCSDVGCVLDKKWVQEISKPFSRKNIDVVSGFYRPVTHNIFQKALATYTSTMPDKVRASTFLPSSRSVAFKKSAWEKAGGYPEKLNTCEDLVFDKRLKHSGAIFYFQKSALVYWPQRKNIWQAAKQFFFYAKGDGEAVYIRKQTPLLFLRYIVGLSILSLGSLLHKLPLSVFLLGICFTLYLCWSIWKNYRYVQTPQAFVWLPILQVVSDITVLFGMSIGLAKTACLLLFHVMKNNKLTTCILFAYVFIVLGGINWGIPNASHPFAYYMDEWASAFSVRSLFRHGTPNVNGGAHGVVFFYFLSGLYLIPFILLHIVNPFIIKGPFSFIGQQHLLFQILRSYSLLNGLAAAIMIGIISKKYLSIKPFFSVLFLVATPLFLFWSLFFKYDMAVTFWITLSIFFGIRFLEIPTKKRYFFFGLISALAVCTKISAAPLFLVYILSFFLFTKNPKAKLSWLFQGVLLFGGIFLVFGIPDIFIASKEFLHSVYINIAVIPFTDPSQYQFGKYYLLYYLTFFYPSSFGHLSYLLYIFSLLFVICITIKRLLYRKFSDETKIYIFLLLGFFSFIISLMQIRFGAGGYRLLVLMPYLALFTGISVQKILKTQMNNLIKRFLYLLLGVLIILQLNETLIVFSTETYLPDLRVTSSKWMQNHIPKGTLIGIEDVPIFQFEPDLVLTEYYKKMYFPNQPITNNYLYKIVDKNTQDFPRVVIVSNVTFDLGLLTHSSKQELVHTLQKKGYKEFAVFTPDLRFLRYIYKNDANLGFILYSMPSSLVFYER